MASDTPSPVDFDPSAANDENQLPMNVPGQRFALLNINVAPAKCSPSADNDRNIKAAGAWDEYQERFRALDDSKGPFWPTFADLIKTHNTRYHWVYK